MVGRVEGKVTIVTGGAAGIGLAIAQRFAAEGARLVIADFSGEEQAAAASLGAVAVHADMSDPASIDALVETTLARYGRLDIVCNNAGRGGGHQPFHEIPLATYDAIIGVNLRGAFLMLQKSIAQMLKNGGGAIVNTASIAAFLATPGSGAYISSKGGILAMTRSAALEYADRNIRVNALCPGTIDTELVRRAGAALRGELLARIPMRRFGSPEEMANAALFLASDEASYITGIGLIADGGRCAS